MGKTVVIRDQEGYQMGAGTCLKRDEIPGYRIETIAMDRAWTEAIELSMNVNAIAEYITCSEHRVADIKNIMTGEGWTETVYQLKCDRWTETKRETESD